MRRASRPGRRSSAPRGVHEPHRVPAFTLALPQSEGSRGRRGRCEHHPSACRGPAPDCPRCRMRRSPGLGGAGRCRLGPSCRGDEGIPGTGWRIQRAAARAHAAHVGPRRDALAVQPGSGSAAAQGYGGFVAFRTGRAGPYRVSLDERAWIEIIAQGSNRPSVETESDKRMRCFGVSKNLAFELSADTLYSVQISGAGRPSAGLLISPPGD